MDNKSNESNGALIGSIVIIIILIIGAIYFAKSVREDIKNNNGEIERTLSQDGEVSAAEQSSRTGSTITTDLEAELNGYNTTTTNDTEINNL